MLTPRRRQRARGDGGGVGAQQAVVGVGAVTRLAEGVGVQLDDLDAEAVGRAPSASVVVPSVSVKIAGTPAASMASPRSSSSPGLASVSVLVDGSTRAEDLEAVAVGEVAEGVVVGDEDAVGRRGRRRGSPSSSSSSAVEVGLGRRHAAVDGRSVGAGGDERVAERRQCVGDAGRVEPDVRVVAVVVVTVGSSPSAPCSSSSVALERVDVVADGEHRHAAVGDGVEGVVERLLQPEPVGDDEGRRRRAPRGPAATARRRGGRRRRGRSCGRRGCRRRRPGRRCRPRCRSWRRRSRRPLAVCRRRPRAAAASSDRAAGGERQQRAAAAGDQLAERI